MMKVQNLHALCLIITTATIIYYYNEYTQKRERLTEKNEFNPRALRAEETASQMQAPGIAVHHPEGAPPDTGRVSGIGCYI